MRKLLKRCPSANQIMIERRPVHWAEASAVIYLAAPVFLFFANFVIMPIAVPADVFMAFCIYRLIRSTAFRLSSIITPLNLYLLCIAVAWVCLSGGFGSLYQNSDWRKHYSIINLLAQKEWPPLGSGDLANSVLRYSIGWYIVPAAFLKITTLSAQNVALSTWSTIGVLLLFVQITRLATSKAAAIAAPLVFIVFGGADIIGTWLTGFHNGPPYHIQWWSGWIEFPANTTSLFWVPQHAIPAWLGAVMLLRQQREPNLLPYIALIFAVIALWSPFAAIGLVPFAFAVALKHGFGKIVLRWQTAGSIAILAIPIAVYLTSGTAIVPHGFIWTLRCNWPNSPCFSAHSYLLFIALEVGLAFFILVLFRRSSDRSFLIAAAITITLVPLYRIGANNDFSTRSCLPALCLLAVLLNDILFQGPRYLRIATVLLLLFSIPTAIGEIYRGFEFAKDVSPDTTFADPWAVNYIDQYFARLPVWIIRHRRG